MLHGLQSGCKERFPRIMVSSYFPRGSTMTRKGESSLPFSLIQNRTGDYDASFAHLRRSALQPSPQCTATAPAVHCNRSRSALQPPLQCTASARTYLVYFKRKYMRPPRITFATADANVINRGCKRLREKAPSLRIPFLPCSPHRAEGRRYHNSRPRGGVPNTSAQ